MGREGKAAEERVADDLSELAAMFSGLAAISVEIAVEVSVAMLGGAPLSLSLSPLAVPATATATVGDTVALVLSSAAAVSAAW